MFAVVESYVESKLDELNQNYDTDIKINQITNVSVDFDTKSN